MRQLLIAILLLAIKPFHALAAYHYVVVPNGLRTTNGNYAANLPFSTYIYRGPMRYQQVYNASQFSELPPGGGFITRIFFRASWSSTGGNYFSNTVFTLSITPKSADNLTNIFDANHGSNRLQIAFDPQYLPDPYPSFSSGGSEINLPTAYYYDPSRGNLLMEIRHDGGYPQFEMRDYRMDGHDILGDGVSRIVAYSATATNATIVDSVGIVTMFEIFEVPAMNIIKSNALINIHWRSHSNVFMLQRSYGIGNGTGWINIPGGYGSEYFDRRITLPINQYPTNTFYRLIWQGPGGP